MENHAEPRDPRPKTLYGLPCTRRKYQYTLNNLRVWAVRNALAYVLKLADRDDGHWDFSNNLSLFLPESVELSNAQCRRRYRRHLARSNSPPDRVTVDSCFDIQ
jgi:hypothetical protein